MIYLASVMKNMQYIPYLMAESLKFLRITGNLGWGWWTRWWRQI